MRGTEQLSIRDFNTVALMIEEVGDNIANLDQVPMTVEETKILGKIELLLIDLAVAMRRRLELSAT